MKELDRERVERMTAALLLVIRDNYELGPTSPDRCFEALNALALSAAFVIHGADGPGGDAHRVFTQGLEQQLEVGDEAEPMRPLLITADIKAQAASLVEFARTDIYRPGMSETVPGDDARHVLAVPFGYRCVFSFTEAPGGSLWRHLSISVPAKDKYPNVFSAFTIAQDLFGFTGWDAKSLRPPEDWQFILDKKDHCVVLVQAVP